MSSSLYRLRPLEKLALGVSTSFGGNFSSTLDCLSPYVICFIIGGILFHLLDFGNPLNMEVLGIASSIAGLISLADIVAFKISRYYTLVKSAHSDIKDLFVEVQSLYGVLNSLRLLATCLEDHDEPYRKFRCSTLRQVLTKR